MNALTRVNFKMNNVYLNLLILLFVFKLFFCNIPFGQKWAHKNKVYINKKLIPALQSLSFSEEIWRWMNNLYDIFVTRRYPLWGPQAHENQETRVCSSGANIFFKSLQLFLKDCALDGFIKKAVKGLLAYSEEWLFICIELLSFQINFTCFHIRACLFKIKFTQKLNFQIHFFYLKFSYEHKKSKVTLMCWMY